MQCLNKTGFLYELSWDTGQNSNFQEEKKLEDGTGSARSLPRALQSQAQSQLEKMDRTDYPDLCASLGQGEGEGQKSCLASQR